MKKLVSADQIEDNTWIRVESSEQLAEVTNNESKRLLLAADLFSEHLSNEKSTIGLWLTSDAEVESFQSKLENVTTIAIYFEKFADGRGFSLARILRQQLKFSGTIIALGDALPDQIFYLRRCGFDTYEVEAKDADYARAQLSVFSNAYQHSSDERKPVQELRVLAS